MTEANEDPEVERARGLVGHVLDGKWTLERLLGAGAMGAVYAGRHRNGARAAVKLLHPELARIGDIRERFLREGYAANRVGHRGAVQVLDDDIVAEGPDEGTAYLVMEMLEGESLEDRLDRGERMDEREILSILDEVLEVLDAAHASRVVHRDLKPANLFLAKDEERPYRIKVLDFGLARLDERATTTRAGLAMGTPSYMAPEQASGRVDEIDGRSDLFALGATAFVLASGHTVHEAGGLLELVALMGTTPARKLRDVAPEVAPELASIVDKALEFRREDRYPNAAAMRADVRARLAQLNPSPASTTELVAPVPSSRGPVTAMSIAEDVGAPPRRESRRSTGLLFFLALVAIGVFAVAKLGLGAQIADALGGSKEDAGAPSAAPLTAAGGPALRSEPVVDAHAPEDAGLLLATPPVEPERDAGLDLDASAAIDDLDGGEEEEEEEDDAEDGGLGTPLAGGARADAAAPHAKPKPKPTAPKPTKKPVRKKKVRRRRHW